MFYLAIFALNLVSQIIFDYFMGFPSSVFKSVTIAAIVTAIIFLLRNTINPKESDESIGT